MAVSNGPAKLDLRKVYKALYSPSAKTVSVVDVPDLAFIMLDGSVEPGSSPSNSEGFRRGIEAMYGISYGVKFISKLRAVDPVDFTVMTLEGLWPLWEGGTPPAGAPMDFTLLMMQPDHVTDEMVRMAVDQGAARHANPLLEHVRLERWREGLCLQVMHVGPYADEPRTMERLASYAAEHAYRNRGRHHEIYLGDPRRARPENLRTILRQPVSAA